MPLLINMILFHPLKWKMTSTKAGCESFFYFSLFPLILSQMILSKAEVIFSCWYYFVSYLYPCSRISTLNTIPFPSLFYFFPILVFVSLCVYPPLFFSFFLFCFFNLWQLSVMLGTRCFPIVCTSIESSTSNKWKLFHCNLLSNHILSWDQHVSNSGQEKRKSEKGKSDFSNHNEFIVMRRIRMD